MGIGMRQKRGPKTSKGAHWASHHIFPHLSFHGWPPVALFYHKDGSFNSRVEERREVWVQGITQERREYSAGSPFRGYPSSTGTLATACLTLSSLPPMMAPTKEVEGRMLEGVSPEEEESNWQDSASGLTFLKTGRYDRVKLNL